MQVWHKQQLTGDIKEGLMAGLTAGLGSKIFSGAGDLQVGKDALTTSNNKSSY